MNPDRPNTSPIGSPTSNIAEPANQQPSERSKIGITWISLAIFVVVLLLLLIFIIQNSEPVRIKYFGVAGTLGFGVAMLLAAVVGSILTLLVGSARIIQLKSNRRLKK